MPVASAAKPAAIHSIVCRCQTRVAVAARKLGLIQADHAVALSLSMTHKAVGFDRPMPEAEFDNPDLPSTGTLPTGVPGASRHGGARNRPAPPQPIRRPARSPPALPRPGSTPPHAECAPSPQGPAHVEPATPGPHGAWLVQYEIGGQQLTDYWYYTARRGVFDLLLSNPDAARLYRLPFAQYAAQTGCQDH